MAGELKLWIILLGLCILFFNNANSRPMKVPEPTNVRLVKATDNSISITWDYPKDELTNIKNYRVDLQFCVDIFDCRVMELLRFVPLKDKIMTISYLTTNMEYTVTVRAENVHGLSSRESEKLKVVAKEEKKEGKDFVDSGRRKGISAESLCAENVRKLQLQGYSDKDGILEKLVKEKKCSLVETQKFIKQVVSISPECSSD